MYHTSQKLTAEFLGTFALVFFGEGAACAVQYVHGALDVNLLTVALAHGLANPFRDDDDTSAWRGDRIAADTAARTALAVRGAAICAARAFRRTQRY